MSAFYVAETDSYEQARRLDQDFRKFNIEASITQNGVSVSPQPQQVSLMQQMCKNLNIPLRMGYTGNQKELLMESLEGVKKIVRVEGDARALLKEWEQ